MKPTLRTERLPLALVAVAFAMAAIAWPSTPDRVPIHFGLDGRPDAFGSRAQGLMIFPIVAIVLYMVGALPLLLSDGKWPAWVGRPLNRLRVTLLGFVLSMFAVTLGVHHGVIDNVAWFVFPALAMLVALIIGPARELEKAKRMVLQSASAESR